MKSFGLSLLLAAGGFATSYAITKACLPKRENVRLNVHHATVSEPSTTLTRTPKSLYERELQRLERISTASTPESFKRLLGGSITKDYQLRSLWSSRDPAGLLKHGLTIGDVQMINEAVRSWFAKDPQAAEQAVMAIGEDKYRRAATSDMVWEAFRSDAAKGVSLLAKHQDWMLPSDGLTNGPPGYAIPFTTLANALDPLKDSFFQREMAGHLTRAWAAKDPTAAAEWAKSLPAGRARQKAFLHNVYPLAQSDPEAAIQFLAEAQTLEPDFVPWGSSLGPIMEQRLLDNPGEAIELASRYLPLSQRGYMIEEAFSKIVTYDLDGAKAIASELPDSVRAAAVSKVGEAMSKVNPREAFQWVADRSIGRAPLGNMTEAAQTWVKRDFKAALSFAEETPDPTSRRVLAVAAVSAIDQWETPQAAVEYAFTLPTSNVAEAVRESISAWSERHPEEATRHALTLPEGTPRTTAIYHAGADLMRTNADKAMALFQTLTTKEDIHSARSAIGITFHDEAKRQGLIAQLPRVQP